MKRRTNARLGCGGLMLAVGGYIALLATSATSPGIELDEVLCGAAVIIGVLVTLYAVWRS